METIPGVPTNIPTSQPLILNSSADNITPECDPNIKPFVDQMFNTLEDGIAFYRRYATVVGFDARRSSEKLTREREIGVKYVVCSREGFKHPGGGGQTTIRRRISKRVGCSAKIVFNRIESGIYIVHMFDEAHNHRMCSGASKPFLLNNRKLDLAYKNFVLNCIKPNIGTAKGFKLYKEIMGGSSKAGATSVDFRNFKRNVMAYIGDANAKIVLEKYLQKKELYPSFYFRHYVDEFDQLARVFWADGIARRNFAWFGDAVSCGATYGTNRYNMVLVPFTGVDNHRKSITFAMGLISKEDVESYVWLLENFKTAMGHEPGYIITDQDPALKIAVPQVFTSARHRFCMWHIMSKVGDKVRPAEGNDVEFRRTFNPIVWDELCTIQDFEARWLGVIEQFGLQDQAWLKQMFEMRAFWIPAFFRDLPMGGLLRTTSRSESQNSVFGSSISEQSNLVEFFIRFEGVMETQRFEQAKLDAACEGNFPTLKTPWVIERYAVGVYTITIFHKVQEEIVDCLISYRIVSASQDGVYKHVLIEDEEHREFNIMFTPATNSADCSCRMFQRVGLVCRHIFAVFKDMRMEYIPEHFVLSQWSKDATKSSISRDAEGMVIENNNEGGTTGYKLRQAWNEFHTSIGLAGGRDACLDVLTGVLRDHNEAMINADPSLKSVSDNTSVIQTFCGVRPSSNIDVRPPSVARNKGSGKRFKSAKELAIEKTTKAKRKCKSCNQLAHHDSRNCPYA